MKKLLISLFAIFLFSTAFASYDDSPEECVAGSYTWLGSHYNNSFTDTPDGSLPPRWYDDGDGVGSTSVAASYNGRTKVMAIIDTSYACCRQQGYYYFEQNWTNNLVTDYYWLYTNYFGFPLWIQDASFTDIWTIRVYSNQLQWYDSGGGTHNFYSVSSGTWYHLKAVLDLDANLMDLYLNDGLILADYAARNGDVTNVYRFFAASIYSPASNQYIDDFRVYTLNNYTGAYGPCCGDDGLSDTFYNSTSVCYKGSVTEDADSYEGFCEYNNYDWLNNSNYPATYSFTDDADDASPAGWTLPGGSYTGKVVSEYDSHGKVFMVEDQGTSGSVIISQLWGSTQANGTIDFWIYPVNTNKFLFQLRNSQSNAGPYITFENNIIERGIFPLVKIADCPSGKWTHMRIDYESTSGGYEGLSQYKWFVYVNGVKYGPFDFISYLDNWDRLIFAIPTSSEPYFYIDAVGYSWDDTYTIGDNKLASCCGDDGEDDTFYNSTSLCYGGGITNNADLYESYCELKGYIWFTGEITGDNSPCCGDDSSSDNFNNGTHACTAGVFGLNSKGPANCSNNHIDINNNHLLDAADGCGLGNCTNGYLVDEDVDYNWDGYCYSGALSNTCTQSKYNELGGLPPFNSSFALTINGNVSYFKNNVPLTAETIVISFNGNDYYDTTDELGGWSVSIPYTELNCSATYSLTARFTYEGNEYNSTTTFTTLK